MWSNYLQIMSNYLVLFTIIVGSVRAQRYENYNYYARPQIYQYHQSQKPAAPYFLTLASAPAPSGIVHSKGIVTNLNGRQNHDMTAQIVEDSERFTFEMIYVSENYSAFELTRNN